MLNTSIKFSISILIYSITMGSVWFILIATYTTREVPLIFLILSLIHWNTENKLILYPESDRYKNTYQILFYFLLFLLALTHGYFFISLFFSHFPLIPIYGNYFELGIKVSSLKKGFEFGSVRHLKKPPVWICFKLNTQL